MSSVHFSIPFVNGRPWTQLPHDWDPTAWRVCSAAFSPHGKTVAAGINCIVSLRCPNTGHKVADMNFAPMTHCSALSVAFSHGMKVKAILAAGCSDGAIYLWTAQQANLMRSQLTGWLATLARWDPSPSLPMAVSWLVEAMIVALDFGMFQRIDNCCGSMVTVAVFYPLPPLETILQAEVQTTLFESGTCRHASTGTELLQMNGHYGWVWSVACSPVGGPREKIVASGGDKSIRL